MSQNRIHIACDTLTPEQEFYQEAYVLLEGAIIEVILRLDIIRKYKTMQHYKDPVEHCKARIKSADQEMIVGELKRCADEIASTDLNFQAIWDMIEDIKQDNGGSDNEDITCRG